MPHFFFHYREPDHLIIDQDGQDFPTIEAAKEEAEQAARDILADKVRSGDIINGDSIEIVTDGEVVLTVPLRSMVRFSA